ncbi:MAG: right-handed parallel beta-helix repeat-containing protein [Acidimicrobiia bacterium]
MLLAIGLTVGVLSSVAPTAGAVVSPVHTVPASIPTNCSRDVTADLLTWITSVPDGSTLAFAPNACYRVDGTLLVRARNHLVFEGNHATFKAFTDGSELGDRLKIRSRSMFSIAKSTDITLRDVVVVGANPHAGRSDLAYRAIYEAQHAYVLGDSHSVVLDHVEAYDVYGDFVYVGWRSSDVTVRNSTFSRNGRQGWTINGTNVLFENNTISETRRATIDMEPSLPTWTARNVTVRNNTIGKGRLLFFASVGASPIIDNVTISGNRLVGKEMSIYVDPPKGTRSNYHVVNNVSDTAISKSGGAAFGFRDIVNLEVRGNVQPVQAGRGISGVSLRNCAHVAVSDNTWLNAKAPIYDLGLSVDVRQSGNRIGSPLHLAPATTVAGPTPLVR